MRVLIAIISVVIVIIWGLINLLGDIKISSIPDGVIASLMLGVSGGLVYMCKAIPGEIFIWVSQRYSYKVSALSTSVVLFKAVNKWISNTMHPMVINNIKVEAYEDEQISGSIDYGRYIFLIDKLTLVIIEKSMHDKTYNSFDSITIQIFGVNKKKYIKEIENELDAVTVKDAIKVYMSQWGDPLLSPKKNIDYLFSPQKDDILESVDTWLNSKDIFYKSGVVYKLGILLYGNPGTGKSSLARCLATYLNWDVISVNLSNISSSNLINWMVSIGKNKIVLLEDVDICTKNRENENTANELDSQPGTGRTVSLDVVLNILDGIYSPSNVIFIATTNYIDRLDSAFKRNGRFDCIFEMQELDEQLAVSMCNRFGADINILNCENYPINQSYLQSKIFSNITKFKKDIVVSK